MQKNLITLYSRVYVPSLKGEDATRGDEVVGAINAEVALFGYTLSSDVLDAMRTLPAGLLALTRDNLRTTLTEITGAETSHYTLFTKFPYETPDQWEYLLRRIIGYLQSEDLIYAESEAKILACGHVIDRRLFDLEDFGACPICQRQVPELLDQSDVVRYAYEQLTPLKMLALADEEFLTRVGSDLLARSSSLSQDERNFIKSLHEGGFELARPNSVYRETLPIVFEVFGDDLGYIRSLLSGATDILRVAAYFSDSTADLSLATPTRFKLTRAQGRRLLSLLDDMTTPEALAADFMRHREMWLRLGERLHPGSAANRRRFPTVAEAFDMVRRDSQDIPTFNRLIERRVRSRTVDSDLLDLLRDRPGELLRRADFLLREVADDSLVREAIVDAAKRAPTLLVLSVAKHFFSRTTDSMRATRSRPRVFFPKGQVNKVQVLPDRRKPVPSSSQVYNDLQDVLVDRFASLSSWGPTYIDPGLHKHLIPFNRRGDSSSSLSLTRGSRYPMGDAPVIRLFVHWTGRDVDLSINVYDSDLDSLGHIAWTNLKSGVATHSGDIQRAPHGASEFIDFDVDKMRNRGVRYVMSSVISYTGEPFNTFPCFVGVMERDALKSGLKFEPASVALKFDLSTPSRSHIPLVFDLEASEVIFADLSTSGGRFGAVARQDDKFKTLTRAVLDLPMIKPTIGDLLTLHARARSTTIVDDQNAAQTVFRAEDDISLDELIL